jgi:hypothetical protein
MSMKMAIQIQRLEERMDALESRVKGDVPEAHVETHATGNEHVGPLRIKHVGFGRWDVVNETGARLNGYWMKKVDAEAFITEHAA